MRDKTVTTLDKTMAILKSFDSTDDAMTPSEIGRKLCMSKATTYRLLRALASGGFLERDPVTGKYSIGPEMYVLGSLYLQTNDLLKAARPVVLAINTLCGETTSLGVYEDGYIVLEMREENNYGLRWRRPIGYRVPAYASAMGLAILAGLPLCEVERLYESESLTLHSSQGIRTRSELLERLPEIRSRGYAVSRGFAEGIEAIGVEIKRRSGETKAGLVVAVPTFRIDNKYRERLVHLVLRSADLISYKGGGSAGKGGIHSVEELSTWWSQLTDVTLPPKSVPV